MNYDKDTIVFQPHPTVHNFIDRTGQQFTRLTVLGYAGTRKPKVASWWCECLCGTILRVDSGSLRDHNTKSCGCLNAELVKRPKSHGHASRGHRSPELHAYYAAKRRCQSHFFKDRMYRERGIEFRFDSFEEFYAEVGPRPSPKHSLDRINNAGHYEPGNLQWALNVDQCRNKSNNRPITLGSETRCIAEWAEIHHIDYQKAYRRLTYQNWCAECTFSATATTCPHKR